MADSISVGSVTATVVPDMSRFADEIKAKSRSISPTIGVSADTTEMRAQIDEAAANRDTTINANADTTEATAQLDEAAHTRTATINAKANGLSDIIGGFSLMETAIAGLGPALIPIGGVLGGLAAALATPLIAAGGGLTLFSFIAGFAVKDTEKQAKQIAQLQTKVEGARLAVQTAASPATKKTAQATLAADTLAYNNALHALTPQQNHFLDAQAKLKTSFQGLEKSAGPAIFGTLTKGLGLLTKLMPDLKPILDGVAKGVDALIGGFAKAAKSPEFKAFLKDFGAETTTAIEAFGKVLGNLAQGFIGLVNAFGPLAGPMLGGIVKLSGEFATFGQGAGGSAGFQNFVAYVKREGPVVLQTIGNLAGAVGRLLGFFAPLGDVVLHAVDGIAGFIRTAKPGELTAIALATADIAAAFGHTPIGLAFAFAALLNQSGPVKSFLKDIGELAQKFVGWFNKLPEGFKEAALVAVGIGAVGIKLKGSLSGLLGGGNSLTGKGAGGGLFGFISKAKPVPVYVTNKGFGADGGIPGGSSLTKKILGGLGLDGLAEAGAGGILSVAIVPASIVALATALAVFSDPKFRQQKPSTKAQATTFAENVPSILNHPALGPAPKDVGQFLAPIAQGVTQMHNLQREVGGVATKTRDENQLLDSMPQRIQRANDKLSTFKGLWDGLSSKTIALNVKTHGDKVANQLSQLGGSGLATGGYVTGPGTGTSDSIPVRLSNGEYVIRAAAVKAIGTSVLDKMNALGYANGGPVTAGGSGVQINVDTVQAHDYHDFMRQMHQRRIRAGGGGVSMS